MFRSFVGEPLTRRRFLEISGLGAAAGLLLPEASFASDSAQVDGEPIGGGHIIQPREVWGADLHPTGEMLPEAAEDVRFLLVHHSASTNDYSVDQTVQYLRSFYRYHTSDEKGWNDIAYNFLIDRYGQIFEGRQGSLESPIRGDATGGSQGFALLTCFVGDHTDIEPTPESQSAMVRLLAWLANTYGIDPSPGATTEFISRGSNLHPAGKRVVTPTITGHRTMSRTTCPGDRAFKLVESAFPAQVANAFMVMKSVPPVTIELPAMESSPDINFNTSDATITIPTDAPATNDISETDITSGSADTVTTASPMIETASDTDPSFSGSTPTVVATVSPSTTLEAIEPAISLPEATNQPFPRSSVANIKREIVTDPGLLTSKKPWWFGAIPAGVSLVLIALATLLRRRSTLSVDQDNSSPSASSREENLL